MSTDQRLSVDEGLPVGSRSSRRDERVLRRARGYRRLVVGTVAVLALLVAAFAGLGSLQGPRMVAADFGGGVRPRLTLAADQPLAHVARAQVHILPATPVDVVASGSTLVLRFPGELAYGTRYAVHVDGVRSLYTGTRTTFRAGFTTTSPSVYSLYRDPRGDDTITRVTLNGAAPSGAGSRVVFHAPRIQTYARLDDALVVVTLGDGDRPTVDVVYDRGGTVVHIPLPGDDGTVRALHVSPDRDLVGFVYDDAQHSDGLYVEDLTDNTGVARQVQGLAGTPLSVLDWTFVPGTTSFIAQDSDQALLLGDLTDPTKLSPLGEHAELRGFLPGTTTLVVADPDRVSALDLQHGTTTTIQLADAQVEDDLYPGPAVVLDAAGDSAQAFAQLDYATSSFGGAFVQLASRSSARLLFRPAGAGTRITGMCLSPNGQYVAVQTVSGEGTADGYPGLPSFSAVSTAFVDTLTGRVARSVQGFLPDWCGGG